MCVSCGKHPVVDGLVAPAVPLTAHPFRLWPQALEFPVQVPIEQCLGAAGSPARKAFLGWIDYLATTGVKPLLQALVINDNGAVALPATTSPRRDRALK
jgi:hypothetical protein